MLEKTPQAKITELYQKTATISPTVPVRYKFGRICEMPPPSPPPSTIVFSFPGLKMPFPYK